MVALTTLILNGATNLPQVNANVAALSDVVITNPVIGDVIYYNGTNWVNIPDYYTMFVLISEGLARQTTFTYVPVSVGTTAPLTPEIGDLWVDTN